MPVTVVPDLMDDTERFADEYLRSLGYTDVVFEPDGNQPPDFLVEGAIAVEVRRFNQFFQTACGSKEPLEAVAEPVVNRVEAILTGFGPSADGKSWFVHVALTRPVASSRLLTRAVKGAFRAFLDAPGRTACTFRVAEGLELDFKEARTPQPHAFMLGGVSDYDAGGFILGETIESLKVVVPEKQEKVAPYRDRYPEWWLVLVNFLSYRLSENDLDELRSSPSVPHNFDKVVLVNPLDTSVGDEI